MFESCGLERIFSHSFPWHCCSGQRDLRLGGLYAAIAFTIMFSELVSWLLFLGLSVLGRNSLMDLYPMREMRPRIKGTACLTVRVP